MSEIVQSCLECDGTTHTIRVFERAHHQERMLNYTSTDAEPSWITGRYPVDGHLTAEMCESCGRVTFRAVPKEQGES